jgi:hypothetical protein
MLQKLIFHNNSYIEKKTVNFMVILFLLLSFISLYLLIKYCFFLLITNCDLFMKLYCKFE